MCIRDRPHFVDEILEDQPVEPEVVEKEVIKEVEVVKEVEVEKEIDPDVIKTPRAVKALEKKLKKKLDDDGTRS